MNRPPLSRVHVFKNRFRRATPIASFDVGLSVEDDSAFGTEQVSRAACLTAFVEVLDVPSGRLIVRKPTD
jgi:hypothetical protein